MAKAAKVEEVPLDSGNPKVKRPRLSKLIIKNFRAIGNTPVEIELDDIVVLVGSNNVGKSTILKAYEIVMCQGSNSGNLSIDDFPHGEVVAGSYPEIEIQTIVYDNAPGNKWIDWSNNNEGLVREKFTWYEPNKPSTRQGWDVESGDWSVNVPWGAPNVANSRRPEPHRVDAFDDPMKQADEIKKLLKKVLDDKVKQHKGFEDQASDYNQLLSKVEELQKAIVADADQEIKQINKDLSALISQVFPNYKVDFDPKTSDSIDKSLSFFKGEAELLMGPEDGYLSTIEKQGSGARRTLLWSALKYISESKAKRNEDGSPVRPHVLLLDEPEICLHPNAIREACNVLYNLPNNNWQVMITTHSPIFIDLSKNNTTIVKVERKAADNVIMSTSVYRPNKLQLSEDDRLNLKLLNIFDPYVAEFFFGGTTIIVEGDTEYTALKYVIQVKPDLYRGIHIVRARGKATIISLIKVLNQFGANYSILHDSDTQLTKAGNKANPAWTINKLILEEVQKKPEGVNIRLLSSITTFEVAYFDQATKDEKPYNALRQMISNQAFFDTVEQLLKSLLDHTQLPPKNCIAWSSMEELEAACK